MFLTPTLRNVATRQVFLHNGVFHYAASRCWISTISATSTPEQNLSARRRRHGARNTTTSPPQYRANVDVADPPFDRQLGDQRRDDAQEEADIIAFLQTLTDGYQPKP